MMDSCEECFCEFECTEVGKNREMCENFIGKDELMERRTILDGNTVLVENAELLNYENADLLKDPESGPESEYNWCLHCQRTYKKNKFRLQRQGRSVFMMCPYHDCDGDYPMDGWNWGKLVGHNSYPEIPVEGVVYPLYPAERKEVNE